VRYIPRIARSRAFLALTLVPAFCAAPLASAEIFKCMEKNGMERYQNFPCSIDSIGSLPSSPPSAASTSPSGGTSQTMPTMVPVVLLALVRAADASEPRIGMTEDEVGAIWGEPDEVIQDEPKEGRIEIWRYGDSRSVQFSNKHRVVAVQR
jgi:hypothetical protein